MDTGTSDGDNVLRRACVDAGAAENTQVSVHGDCRLDAVLFQLKSGDRARQVDGIARADVNTRGTAAGTFVGVEDYFAFKELLDGDSFFGADLLTPAAGDTRFFVDGDLSGKFAAFLDNALDSDGMFRTGGGAHLARVTQGLVLDDLTGRADLLGTERDTLDLQSRAERCADTTDIALLFVDD